MAGIRNFNTNVPHVFRYPEWTEGVFYPSGSVVSLEIVDSDVYYDFYAAIRDVKNLTDRPNTNASEWRRVHDAFQIDSDLLGLLTNLDSEIQRIYETIDSEEMSREDADSDILLAIDSEQHDRKAADSDLYVLIDNHLDSEEHARQAADSDIHHRLREIDSDLKILFLRTDSDEDALQDIRTALLEGLDSEIHARLSADSDFHVIVTQAVHDFLSNDSEHDSEINELKVRLDSDFDAAVRGWTATGNEYTWGPQPFVSNTDFFINQRHLNNHNQGYLWLVDHQNGFIYIIKDGAHIGTRAAGDLLTTTVNTGLFGEFGRGTQITDGGGGADVNIYTDSADALPIATNANLYTVLEEERERAIFEPTTSMDDALRRTVATVVEIDSDLHDLMFSFGKLDSDNDSDHIRFYHDINALDSEQKILKADRDSDNKVLQRLRFDIDSERHDWKAGDSDLKAYFIELFASDVGLSLEHDSELFIKTDSEEKARRNADSDIYNKYHGIQFRYVRQEFEATWFTQLPLTLDFNGAGVVTTHDGGHPVWIWNPFNDRLVIIDSDSEILYNEVHQDEPIEVSVGEYKYRRGYDTHGTANINVDGVLQGTDDVWGLHVDHITKYPNGGLITTIIDSDINLHDRDSDYTTAMVWLGYHLQDVDSDIKMEIHDRKAADSDIIDEFRIPEETIILSAGESDYVLTNPLLNENTRWSYRTEIFSNQSIYNGVVNDHFEINHDGTAWTITVDGVNQISYVDVLVSGSPTVSGLPLSYLWDDNSTVTINPVTGDTTLEIAEQFYNALLDKDVSASFDNIVGFISYSSEGRIVPIGNQTINGVNLNFTTNVVPTPEFYYNDGDTIKITKK